MSGKPGNTKAQRASESLIAIGGTGSELPQVLEVYDPDANSWRELFTMNEFRYHSRCIIFEEKLVMVGGTKDFYFTKDVDSYDFETGQITPMTPMKQEIYECALAVLDGYLYIVGGVLIPRAVDFCDGVERYNSNSKQWETMPPMSLAIRKPVALSLNNELFVIGGSMDGHELSDVQAFNPNTQTWRKCASMNEKRQGVAAEVLGNYIYAFGGLNGTGAVKSAERYDPVSNTWTFIENSNWTKCFAEAAEFNNTIVIAGGKSVENDLKITDDVEYYDPNENSYHILASMTSPRMYFNLLKVPRQLVEKSIALMNKRQLENQKNIK